MIKAHRITLDGNIPLEDASILTEGDLENSGILPYFEDAQIVIRNKDGTFVLPQYKIVLIQLNTSTKKIQPPRARRVKRIMIKGNLAFSPACVVNPGEHNSVGVPSIFRTYEQFVFACNDGLFITTDFNVIGMEL